MAAKKKAAPKKKAPAFLAKGKQKADNPRDSKAMEAKERKQGIRT